MKVNSRILRKFILKNFKFVLLLLLTALFSVSILKSQVTIGVTPSLTFNGFYVGYELGNFVPYIGLQFVSGSMTVEDKHSDYDMNGNLIDHSSKDEVSASIYMPSIGGKYFLLQKGEVKAYLGLSLFKPIISAKEVNNGQTNETLTKNMDNLSVWGGEFGFGAEYFMSKQFSLGGEFGFRLFWIKTDIEDKISTYNPRTGNYVDLPRTYSTSLNLSATYAKISFNYYFKD